MTPKTDPEVDIASSINIESTESLTGLIHVCHTPLVPRSRDVLSHMRDAMITDAKRLGELATQRQTTVTCSLGEAYHRYLANLRDTRNTEESLHSIQAFLGEKLFTEAMDGFVFIETEMDPSPSELRETTALWQQLRTYLRFAQKARVSEALEALRKVGIESSRQALESAIRAHPREFRVQRHGREVFVSMKAGEQWSDAETATPIRPTRRRT